jgi:phenylacetate-CoA ligase
MEKVTGRSDDMIILRGVNVFPTQFEEIILRTPALSPHFQLELSKSGRLDHLTVRVERRPDTDIAAATAAASAVGAAVKDTVGVNVGVEIVEPYMLERSLGKLRRVVDKR